MRLNAQGLELIAYAATLTRDLVPRRVPAVFAVRRNPDQIVMPPYEWQGGDLVTPTVHSHAEFISGEDATLLPRAVEAIPGHVLWIDEKFSPHYEAARDAQAHLTDLAKRHARQAQAAFARGDLDGALREAQAAICADDQNLNAVLIKAAVHRARGNDNRVRVLIDIAQSIDPHLEVVAWLDMVPPPVRAVRWAGPATCQPASRAKLDNMVRQYAEPVPA